MPARVSIELRGLLEQQRDADRMMRELGGPPIIQAVRDATMVVTRTARQEAKVDMGAYRASIVPLVEVGAGRIVGSVGSDLDYARYVVLDTRPHWPPIAALAVWARRHGVSAYLVARAIARRGTKGDKSLIKGIENNVDQIIRLIERAVERTTR
jgi:hypothetical protein